MLYTHTHTHGHRPCGNRTLFSHPPSLPAVYLSLPILTQCLSLCPPVPVPVPRLAQQYLYPQAFVQPSLVLPSQVSGSVGSSPYLDYNTAAAYSQYAQAAFDQHYPYAPSPASFMGYTYAPGSASSGTSSAAAAATAAAASSLAAMHASLASSGAAGQSQAFLHYPPQQHVQPERMQ